MQGLFSKRSLQSAAGVGELPAGGIVLLPPALQGFHVGRTRLVTAVPKIDVVSQQRFEVRVSALLDNVSRPAHSRTDGRIDGIPLFRHQTLDVVLRVIDVAHVWHDAAVRPPIFQPAHRRCVHDADIGVAEKVSASAQAVEVTDAAGSQERGFLCVLS